LIVVTQTTLQFSENEAWSRWSVVYTLVMKLCASRSQSLLTAGAKTVITLSSSL